MLLKIRQKKINSFKNHVSEKFEVLDENNNNVGEVTDMRNISLAVGGIEIELFVNDSVYSSKQKKTKNKS